MWCLNGNVPHGLRPLNTCSPVGGTVHGDYGTIQRWSISEVQPILALWFTCVYKNVMPLLTSLAAFLCHVHHDGLYLSGTINENNCFFMFSLIIVVYHSHDTQPPDFKCN